MKILHCGVYGYSLPFQTLGCQSQSLEMTIDCFMLKTMGRVLESSVLHAELV